MYAVLRWSQKTPSSSIAWWQATVVAAVGTLVLGWGRVCAGDNRVGGGGGYTLALECVARAQATAASVAAVGTLELEWVAWALATFALVLVAGTMVLEWVAWVLATNTLVEAVGAPWCWSGSRRRRRRPRRWRRWARWCMSGSHGRKRRPRWRWQWARWK